MKILEVFKNKLRFKNYSNRTIDRDYNAAINIKNGGIKLFKIKIVLNSPKLTPLERTTIVDSLKKEKNVRRVVIK